MSGRYHASPRNPRWRDIERAYARRERLAPKQAAFITDLWNRGQNYLLSDKQHRYLSSIITKLNRQAAGHS